MSELYNEMLIRNVDCGLLYFQIKDDEAIRKYEDLKKEKKLLGNDKNADEKNLQKYRNGLRNCQKRYSP